MGRVVSLAGVLLSVTAFVCSCDNSSQRGQDAHGRGSSRLRVLILSGHNHHDWRRTTAELKRIYEDSGRFVVDVTNDPAECDAATFAKYDVVVSNWSAWPRVTGISWGAETEKAMLEFVLSGKGFVLFHSASASFYDWPQYHKLIGGAYKEGISGHTTYHTFKVIVTEDSHPVTRGMKDFWITDELYQTMVIQPGADVLCKAFASEDEKGTGKMEPVVICTEFGRGRGFHFVLGHDVTAMRNVGWQTVMLRGTEWAATSRVTIGMADHWPSERESAVVRVKKTVSAEPK